MIESLKGIVGENKRRMEEYTQKSDNIWNEIDSMRQIQDGMIKKHEASTKNTGKNSGRHKQLKSIAEED